MQRLTQILKNVLYQLNNLSQKEHNDNEHLYLTVTIETSVIFPILMWNLNRNVILSSQHKFTFEKCLYF